MYIHIYIYIYIYIYGSVRILSCAECALMFGGVDRGYRSEVSIKGIDQVSIKGIVRRCQQESLQSCARRSLSSLRWNMAYGVGGSTPHMNL